MTQEEKSLLLKDLCARLPYGVKIAAKDDNEPYTLLAIHPNKDIAVIGLQFDDVFATSKIKIDCISPYLRTMSSMTEEEQKEFVQFHCVNLCPIIMDSCLTIENEGNMIDWLNAHHFDYRGLIEKNLALDCTGLHIYD